MGSQDLTSFESSEASSNREHEELQAVLSTALRPKSNMAQLLSYVCEKHFQGLDHEIKEYSIAVEVFGRTADFDSSRDSIVRVEAHRLRSRLDRYYKELPTPHPLRIVIPAGSYVPHFLPSDLDLEEAPAAATAHEAQGSPGSAALPTDEVLFGDTMQSRWSVRRRVLLALSLILVCAASIAILKHRASRQFVAPAPSKTVLSTAGANGVALRMLCGLQSQSFVDSRGDSWVGDRYFSGGDSQAIAPRIISLSDDPNIYYRRRRGTAGTFAYNIPLAPGSYEVKLHFADAFFGENNADGGGEGSRIFDVTANGAVLLKNFDVIADAGGSNTADVKVFRDVRPAADGFLHLTFISRRDIAFVNAIEIFKTSDRSTVPERIVMSTRSYLDSQGHEWASDRYSRGGVRSNEPVTPPKTPDEELWRNERFGNFSYTLPVAVNSTYAVTIRFKENIARPPLPDLDQTDIFNVFVNGQLLLEGLRVPSVPGANAVTVRTFPHLKPNTQGKLIFSFVPLQNYAVVNSIEVLDEGGKQ